MNERVDRQDVFAMIAAMYQLDGEEDEPIPSFVFITPECIPQPRWRAFAEARAVGTSWAWSSAEKSHLAVCNFCRRREQSYPLPPRPRRPWVSRRSVVAGLIAACLIVGVGIGVWALVSGGASPAVAQPLSPAPTLKWRQAAMGAGHTPIAGTITWPLLDHLGGYIAVLEWSPDGSLEARPGPLGECQMVATGPKPDGIPINLLFSPSTRGSKIVWVFLTETPANKVLAKLANELSGDAKLLTTERILDALKANKVVVRDFGQLELRASDTPPKQ